MRSHGTDVPWDWGVSRICGRPRSPFACLRFSFRKPQACPATKESHLRRRKWTARGRNTRRSLRICGNGKALIRSLTYPVVEKAVPPSLFPRRTPYSSSSRLREEPERPPRGRQAYARRKVTVEPVFGQIEQGRGFRQFLLRGMEKVRTEWSLICTGHNILKLWRAASTDPPKVRS